MNYIPFSNALPEYHIMNMKEKASRKLWSMAKEFFTLQFVWNLI